MKILLRVPDLIEAIQPFVQTKLTINQVFELIANGQIKAFGFVQRAPVFELSQIREIVDAINSIKFETEDTDFQQKECLEC